MFPPRRAQHVHSPPGFHRVTITTIVHAWAMPYLMQICLKTSEQTQPQPQDPYLDAPARTGTCVLQIRHHPTCKGRCCDSPADLVFSIPLRNGLHIVTMENTTTPKWHFEVFVVCTHSLDWTHIFENEHLAGWSRPCEDHILDCLRVLWKNVWFWKINFLSLLWLFWMRV